METVDGKLVVIGGRSRSGKTAYTVQAVKNAKRLAVWDPEDQWSQLRGFKRVTTRTALVAEILKPGAFKIAFVAGGDLKAEFDYWAHTIFHAGRYIAPLDCIAEELADVTSPAKAPGNWGILLRRGLKRGINIYAISQRWAEADKTAVGNASEFVLFAQSSQDDVRYLARKTRVPERLINELVPLEYITFNPSTSTHVKRKLTFK